MGNELAITLAEELIAELCESLAGEAVSGLAISDDELNGVAAVENSADLLQSLGPMG